MSKNTYILRSPEQNLIVARDVFKTVKKAEKRLNHENSEDALTWNLFVGLFAVDGLQEIFCHLTGFQPAGEPELFLWGNRITPHGCRFWDRLDEVQKKCEPGKGIPTEPDVILRIPGQAIVLVEAKFGSPNSRYDKKVVRCGPVASYFATYPPPDQSPDPLNRTWLYSQKPGDVLEQLCRNAVFAPWLAGKGEQTFLINLVCANSELDVEQQFGQHLNPETVVFRRMTWEGLFSLPAIQSQSRIREYLREKTISLQPAFPKLRG